MRVIIKRDIYVTVYKAVPDYYSWVYNSDVPQLVLRSDFKKIDSEEMFNGELDFPVLDINKMIYIDNLGESVTIKEVLFSTDGSMTYKVSNKFIENEETINSREEALKKIEDSKPTINPIVLNKIESIPEKQYDVKEHMSIWKYIFKCWRNLK